MNYIITKNKSFFEKTGEYQYCQLDDMILPEMIACDSETTGLVARKDDVFCIQIGSGENNYLIKMYDGEYTFNDVIPYIKDKTLCFHNAQFDLGFFYKYNFFPKDIKDTYLASRILYNGSEEVYTHDFSSVMQRELDLIYDKGEQKSISSVKLSRAETIQYCFNDVDKLLNLHITLEEKIIDEGYEETYKLHCQYIRALAYIEQCGLPISSEKWKTKMENDIKNVFHWKTTIEKYIFDNIPSYRNEQLDLFDEKERVTLSITSPLQMIKVFNFLGINTKDKDGKDSINENIISKSKHQFVEMWLKFQEANHRVTTFGNKIFQKIENERIYTNFNPMVDTARLSTRKNHINFLNFPADKETRDCFEANEGNVMIVCDYSGQETVVAADLSGDAAMTDSVIHGNDLHSAFARILFPSIFHLSDDEIKEHHKDKRQAAKAPRFAFQYGGNAYTIHMNEGVPLDEANKIEKAFKELHSGLYTWGEKVFKISVSKGYIESADGWKLFLPNFKKYKLLEERVKEITKEQWAVYREGKEEYNKHKIDKKYVIIHQRSLDFYKEKKKNVSEFFKLKSEYQRLCLNNPVQSESAHMIKRATVLLFDWIIKNDFQWKVKICNSVHDELVIESVTNLKFLVQQNVEKFMLSGGNYYLTNLKIKADANIGPSWDKAK